MTLAAKVGRKARWGAREFGKETMPLPVLRKQPGWDLSVLWCAHSAAVPPSTWLSSDITAGSFKGISQKPACLSRLFGHCTTFHPFEWLHVASTLLLWALHIFIAFFFFFFLNLVLSLFIQTLTKIDCCTRCQQQRQLTKTAAHSLPDMWVPRF